MHSIPVTKIQYFLRIGYVPCGTHPFCFQNILNHYNLHSKAISFILFLSILELRIK